MSVTRYQFTVNFGISIGGKHHISNASMAQSSDGGYVRFDDYKHLSDYCDHLVEFSKLPCLPKDLEVLRDANANFATQNESLLSENQALGVAIQNLKQTIDCLEYQLGEATRLRNEWWSKWRNCVSECETKVDSVKAHLDELIYQARVGFPSK